jgi:hypothetical protein
MCRNIHIELIIQQFTDFMYSQIKCMIISLRKELNLILGFEINSGFGDSW